MSEDERNTQKIQQQRDSMEKAAHTSFDEKTFFYL
jgi:hypothetical protein